jgi:cytochrome oxidase assembly protein ShyY1
MTHCKTEAIKNKASASALRGFAIIPALLLVLVIASAAASVWQWQRAQLHEIMAQDAMKRQANTMVVNLNLEPSNREAKVLVSGRWLDNSTVYISPRLIDGRLGALIISIFQYKDFAGANHYLAVQRGWAAQSQPSIVPESVVPTALTVELQGNLADHVSRAFELQAFKPVSLGLWPNYNMGVHGALLNIQLDPYVLVLSTLSPDADAMRLKRVPAQSLIDTLKQKASSNIGYAFQWLGLTLVGLCGLLLMWRNRQKVK